jgi:hypothetical protein
MLGNRASRRRDIQEGLMGVYKWQGVSPRGEALKGEMEATSREAVIIRLRSQRIQPKANTSREGKGLDYQIPSRASARRQREGRRHLHAAVRDHDRRRPADRAVPADPRRAGGVPAFRKVIAESRTTSRAARRSPRASASTRRSSATSTPAWWPPASRRHPRHDPRPPRQLSREGRQAEGKIKGAMIYPACIVSAAVIVTGILLIWVIPVFGEVFRASARRCPRRRSS